MTEKTLKVGVVLGSDSDLKIMSGCIKTLDAYGVPCELRIISAHRTPAAAAEFAKNAKANGFGAIIAAAGKAAHLAGALAANTTLPVIAVPVKASALEGLDALLSSVQMPKGVPVATVAIDGGDNAALLAIQILAVSDSRLADLLEAEKERMAREVEAKDASANELLKKVMENK